MPTTTTRLSLIRPVTTDAVDELRLSITANATTLDDAALWGEDVFANRPVSTGGAPGIKGRFFLATDQAPPGGLLYYDYGTGWFGPLNAVDAAAGTASLRTLGTGATQAMAGNATRSTRQTHSFTGLDGLAAPGQIIGSMFADPASGETVKLIEAVVHCTTVGGTPTVLKVQSDHGSHGTLATITGLATLTPSTTQTAVTVTGGPMTLAALDRLALVVVTAGNSLGISVQLSTEHTS